LVTEPPKPHRVGNDAVSLRRGNPLRDDRAAETAPRRPAPVDVPYAVRDAIYDEARKAFPAECCGWIVAKRDAPDRATGIRACANAQLADGPDVVPGRTAETAYVIAGDDLLAFARAFDGDEPPVAIYHSHPNGRAYFSATDRAVARSPWGDGPAYPVQQLVVGLDESHVVEAALFAWSDAAGDFIEIDRWRV
jgi:proteasome lid subunit RPN8/RPN11